MHAIALEEHFATPAYLDGPHHQLKERAEQLGGRFAALVDQLVEIGDGRVAAMDAAKVDVQALSLTAPGVEQLDVEEAKTFARSTNAAWRRFWLWANAVGSFGAPLIWGVALSSLLYGTPLDGSGKVSHGWIGVVCDAQPTELAGGESGARVQGVFDNSPAKSAGLEGGDVVIRADGRPITGRPDLVAAVRTSLTCAGNPPSRRELEQSPDEGLCRVLKDGVQQGGHYSAAESLRADTVHRRIPDCGGLKATARNMTIRAENFPQIVEREFLVEIYCETARRRIRHHASDPGHPGNIGFRFRRSVLIPQFRKLQP